MSAVDEEAGIACRVYTSARRHQQVIGVVQGHAMPWTSTYTQFGAFIATAAALLFTRRWWGVVVPGVVQLVVVAGAPVAAWLLAKRWQPDRRSPGQALVSLVSFALRPRRGRYQGRAVPRFRARAVGGERIFFCGGRA